VFNSFSEGGKERTLGIPSPASTTQRGGKKNGLAQLNERETEIGGKKLSRKLFEGEENAGHLLFKGNQGITATKEGEGKKRPPWKERGGDKNLFSRSRKNCTKANRERTSRIFCCMQAEAKERAEV